MWTNGDTFEPTYVSPFRTRLRDARPGFDSWQGKGYFSLCHRVQIGSGAHSAQPMGTGVTFPGVKAVRLEADHSHLSSAAVKNAWSYTSFMAWCLVKHSNNFALPYRGHLSRSKDGRSMLNNVT